MKSSDFEHYINNTFGINPTEPCYKYTVKELENRCLSKGKIITIHHQPFYDAEKGLLYVNQGNGFMSVLNGNRIQQFDIGTDDVFFHPSSMEPFDPEYNGCDGTLLQHIISKINTDRNAVLSKDDQCRLLTLWCLGLFFSSILPTKPILTCVGPPGSGKTFIQQAIGLMLYGSKFQVSGFSTSRDFDIAVAQEHLIVWDELNQNKPWHQDRLARIATGGAFQKRDLFTNTNMHSLVASAYLAINAKTPEFNWADIAERLLVLRFEKIEKKKSVTSMRKEILRNRNLLLGDLLTQLNNVVKALQEEPVEEENVLRMADFNQLAVTMGKALEIDVVPVLKRLAQEQVEFFLTDNPLAIAIDQLLENGGAGKSFTASALLKRNEFAKVAKTAESLGSKLREQLTGLKKKFRIDVINKHHTNHYTFNNI